MKLLCHLLILVAALGVAAQSAVLDNLTGLPAYPNLDAAVMDKVWKTETLGRWCTRFSSSTTDSLATVEAWYRRRLLQASETELANDDAYSAYPQLSGIKLALGVDYVAIYRLPNQPTIIELHRCGASR
jgi:hypothetical protein